LQDLSSIFIVTPSAFGTSPKYDKKKSECGFKVHIVGFGGGWVGVREKVLRELGLKVIRFRNDEIVKELSTIVGEIKEHLASM